MGGRGLLGLGLRLRVFLFFVLLALGALALAGGALYLGWSRLDPPGPSAPFMTAFLIFAFANTGLVLGVWLLFDENVARPIDRLAAALRLRAHADLEASVQAGAAPYLGDLAPAAEALARRIGGAKSASADGAEDGGEAESLRSDREQLTALLTEIPIATILLNPAEQIILYDAQAAEVLSRIAPPRLRAPVSDYFDMGSLRDAMRRLEQGAGETILTLFDTARSQGFQARMKQLRRGGHMIFIEVQSEPDADGLSARPLVFDFTLHDTAQSREIEDTPLMDLCFVPFDTETTGLSVARDAVVQLSALRVLKGRIVEGEVFDSYVNPGRPIPPASTRIHKITDALVAGAPPMPDVARAFHHFARESVLVAHNAPFDIGLLRRDAAEAGLTWPHPVLDTVLLSAVVFGTTESHTLDALCARLSIDIPEGRRHTALGDADATARALVKLLPLVAARGITTFGALIAETRKHGRLLRDLND
ncbi:3'-5' exonuclease [Poseidonocella sedimentorum]|uniref:DNA-directed DNA polymerase n=1 Tax=Poseidonocella sedimentorum TaxID=871652 RepID=A0A1I6EJ92_9RHOB|nr:3'-5' exonuclease [Poseidonocella sedimentorum]SFR17823.1 DNA polymerase-3 subunit epsilon [Poseidonocella sedimentorum]